MKQESIPKGKLVKYEPTIEEAPQLGGEAELILPISALEYVKKHRLDMMEIHTDTNLHARGYIYKSDYHEVDGSTHILIKVRTQGPFEGQIRLF